MTTKVNAVYSQGQLRLASPMDLLDGTSVEVVVISPGPAPSAEDACDILRRIASLPIEPGSDGFSGSDHDRVLYPATDAS
jgi:hypothetical protein